MGIDRSCISTFGRRAVPVLGLAAGMLIGLAPAAAQTEGTLPGFYLEAEGQRVFGDSDFEAGMVPPNILADTGPKPKFDEGNGWGGALTLGYVWTNGWSAAVRTRRLEADDRSGPIDPGIIAFAAGVPLLPGGFPIGLLDARTKVESKTTLLDFEVGRDIAVAVGRLQLFGGITYMSIERDVALLDDDCGCTPFSVVMANDFHGLGPKIGFRGGFPITDAVSLVGGGSVAALFGTSKFMNHLDDPLFPAPQFTAEDRRTVAAFAADAGIAFPIGPGSLTLGYRIDAVLGALDTDQRVSAIFRSVGFPAIGDRHDDFVEHGPFARLTLPLAGAGN